MSGKYRKFTKEFKEKIVSEIEAGVVSAVEQARRHNLSSGLITVWRRKFSDGTLNASPDRRVKELEKENESLKTTIGDLYRQVEALKKTMDFETRRTKERSLIISGRNLDLSKKPAKR